ncbi:hypothetical protein PHLCEN_2v12497 [Hermanssonia centrifuga]|uniref:Uncharacterized protein n=1 Tax=Hermanssonia centrifuga TaxID=98765 RepID=A0A2R6NGY6_9APHY|nr:hypothetical protein PHLCEN_2v12497 [Hermanssonia centrifuga]
MGALSIGNAEVAAFWVESILFGAFAVLYCIAVKIMLERLANKQKRRTAQLMLATSTTMFVLAIGHMSLDVTRALEAFVGLSGQPGALDVFLATLNNPTHIAKTFLYVTQTMVGDTFVVSKL